jgi:hypothetical protein
LCLEIEAADSIIAQPPENPYRDRAFSDRGKYGEVIRREQSDNRFRSQSLCFGSSVAPRLRPRQSDTRPRADITITGNPDIFSAVVGRSFSGNGNAGFHYDKALNEVNIGVMTDYQIASYVEDVR